MTTDFVVVTVDRSDNQLVGQIHAVQLAAYAIESALIAYPQLPPLFETEDDIRSSAETFLACLLDGQVVGATSYLVTHHTVEICRLVIHPSYFRRGMGSRLLKAVEEQNRQWQTITVSTAAKNHPAIGLYEKHGYHVVQHVRLADGLQLVRLQKQRQVQIT